jgi:hypothetical protein
MCDESPQQTIEQQMTALSQVVADIQRELIDLRMVRRKVMLEELARLEEPLIEMGVLSHRTRPQRAR